MAFCPVSLCPGFIACTLQLGLLEDDMHSAVEAATAGADDDLDDHNDAEEIDNIIQTASTTGKLMATVVALLPPTVCATKLQGLSTSSSMHLHCNITLLLDNNCTSCVKRSKVKVSESLCAKIWHKHVS